MVRLIDWSILNGGAFVAGTTFEVGGGPLNTPWTMVNYREATAAPSQQIWEAASGTITIESIEGTTYRIRIADAHMVPGAPFIFGPPPLGTFTLNATVTIDTVTSN